MVQDLSSASGKPAIVVVPGSFSPAYFYSDVVDKLRESGYETVVENLPSASRVPPEEAATMAEDAALFHDLIAKLADQGKDVVLVTHSYGGVVGTEASKGLSKSERRKNGKEGGLIRLVYLTAVVPTLGNSLADLMGTLIPSYIGFEGDYMQHADADASAKRTFSDLPHDEGVKWVEKMPLHSAPSFQGKLTHAGYKSIPVSFIFCEDDLILPAEFQRQVIETIEKESGKKVDVHSLKTGHCPNISAPNDCAAAILAAVREHDGER